MAEFAVSRVAAATARLAPKRWANLPKKHPRLLFITDPDKQRELYDEIVLPYCWAVICRRLWARGHDIMGMPCPHPLARVSATVTLPIGEMVDA